MWFVLTTIIAQSNHEIHCDTGMNGEVKSRLHM